MREIIYNKNIEPQNKAEIEKRLTPFLWLAPNWCLELYVNLWDSVEGGELASISLSYDYRRITIDFATAWLDRDAAIKEQTIIHELLHGYLGLVADYARDSFNNLCSKDDAPKFNEHLQNELRIRHESATQDLSFALLNKFNADKR